MGNWQGKDGGNQAPDGTTHSLYVKTGDKKGAGTDGSVFARIKDEAGNLSEEKLLDTKWQDDFQPEATDVFHLQLEGVGRAAELQIRRDETEADDEWYLEKVTVVTVENSDKTIFPVNRWIFANQTLWLSEFDSSLPQDDKHPEQRARELEKKRAQYQLIQYIANGPYQIENLPKDEEFTKGYECDIQSMKLKLGAAAKYIDFTVRCITDLDDYRRLFKTSVFPLPYGETNWKSDEEFGNQRLTGCNSLSIALCQSIPEHFAVTAEMVEPFLEGKTLPFCLEKKKIYIVDMTYLSDIECIEDRQLPGPTALFYSKDCGDLVPIAIQLMPVPADDNPVFLPSDPEYTWLAAKMWFNMADASHHQSITHLTFTHIVMEAVAVCSNRQLSPSHPIFRLLAPHFLYLIAINRGALTKLMSAGGWTDDVMHIGHTGMNNIIIYNWARWNIKENGNPIENLKARGVDDPEALPNYHYRDDAVLIWDAIHKYVTEVVNGVYDSADKLANDHEIHAWATELANADFKGMPTTISSPSELAEIVSSFIFIGSVGHAAANFGQYDEYAFTPNYPPKLLGERPKDKTPLTEADIVACLPPKEEIVSTMTVTKLLSGRGTNELGNFEVQYGFDPVSTKALEQFRADLQAISVTVDERNEKRVRKYPYLNPKEVPNAISI